MPKSQYQLFDRLRDEDYAALKADIEKRGVLIPVEKDEAGNILDGHHRQEIADELGIECPVKVRKFKTEEEKREHVIKINMARRHLEPYEWGLAFKRLLAERGVVRKKGANQGKHSATVAECASELGVSDRTARHRLSQADKFEAMPKKSRDAIRNRQTTVAEVKREQKKEEHNLKKARAKVRQATIAGPFSVVLADPPWRYDDAKPNRAVENHYDTATVDEIVGHIKGLNIAESCILLMWATAPKMVEAMEVMRGWGFLYRTHAIWDKQKIGMGYWFRGQHELLLVGTRGNPASVPEPERRSSIFVEARQEHSVKPECVYQWIEAAFPEHEKLEMYCRNPRAGWAVWGNEV